MAYWSLNLSNIIAPPMVVSLNFKVAVTKDKSDDKVNCQLSDALMVPSRRLVLLRCSSGPLAAGFDMVWVGGGAFHSILAQSKKRKYALLVKQRHMYSGITNEQVMQNNIICTVISIYMYSESCTL